MPEGPEVAVTANELNNILSGKYIHRIIIYNPNSFDGGNEEYILPLKIINVISTGKKIIIKTDKNYNICCKMGMTGRWSKTELNNSRIEFNFGSKKNFISYKIFFIDPRSFGQISMVHDNDLENYLGSVGIDLLSESEKVTSELWLITMKRKPYINWQICKYLLHQEEFSGIGNYLKGDILWISKIKPDRKISSLSDEEIENLRINTLSLIRESFEAGGLTISDYYPPSNKKGMYNTRVYMLSFDPLGNKLIKQEFGDGRKTSWTSEIQK